MRLPIYRRKWRLQLVSWGGRGLYHYTAYLLSKHIVCREQVEVQTVPLVGQVKVRPMSTEDCRDCGVFGHNPRFRAFPPKAVGVVNRFGRVLDALDGDFGRCP
jgi:hypothetical protein